MPAPCAVRPNSEELEATPGLFIIQPRLAIRGQGLDGLVNQRVAVIELCQPDHAGEILADDRAKVVTSMMPCRISVYETEDDRVIVSRMNTRMMAEMFGGSVAEGMPAATEEVAQVLAAEQGD